MFHVDQLVSLLDCLVFQKTMAIKNFIFSEKFGGSEVSGIKIAFFAIFDLLSTKI